MPAEKLTKKQQKHKNTKDTEGGEDCNRGDGVRRETEGEREGEREGGGRERERDQGRTRDGMWRLWTGYCGLTD